MGPLLDEEPAELEAAEEGIDGLGDEAVAEAACRSTMWYTFTMTWSMTAILESWPAQSKLRSMANSDLDRSQSEQECLERRGSGAASAGVGGYLG